MKEKGFWVKYSMYTGQRREEPSKVSYSYYLYSDGYTEEDKEDNKLWMGEAESWSQHDGEGWSYREYEYAYEMIDSPPKEWLERQLKFHKTEYEFYKECLEEQT